MTSPLSGGGGLDLFVCLFVVVVVVVVVVVIAFVVLGSSFSRLCSTALLRH